MYGKLAHARSRVVSTPRFLAALSGVAGPLGPWLRDGVFMFHQGRCGSTVVALMLDQHPQIASLGEIFEPSFQRRRMLAPAETLLRAARVRGFPRHALAEAKFMECQHLATLGMGIEDFVAMLKRLGYRRFVVLRRRNYLRMLLSTILGGERGRKYHFLPGEHVPETRIRLDPAITYFFSVSGPMHEVFGYMDGQYARLDAALAGEDVLQLTYEDDISEDPQVAYGRVCRWLGLAPVPAGVKLQKANPRSTQEVLENWEEMRGVLEGTRYAWMLA